jgi:putative transposase
MVFCQQLGCEVVELNVQADHVQLLVKIPPRRSVSDLMGTLKGRTAIRMFSAFPFLKKRPYWGNHFWAKGYCVDTVGLNSEMIQKYVRFQDKEEQHQEQLQLEPDRVSFSEGAIGVLPSGEHEAKPRSMNVVRLLTLNFRNRPVPGTCIQPGFWLPSSIRQVD